MSYTLIQLTAAGIFTMGIVYFLIPLLIKMAYLMNLYDQPDGSRKLHRQYISSLGGVAIFIGLFIGFSISGFSEQISGYGYLAAALLMLFFTGLKDDLIGLSPSKKLFVEIFGSLLVIFGLNLTIDHFFGVFGIDLISIYISLPLTIFTLIVVMNAYNLIDGIDGLAGGLGVIALLFLGAGFLVAGDTVFAVFSLISALALFAFLIHNFHPANIFMGDAGSLTIGFIIGLLSIRYIGLSQNDIYSDVFANASAVLPIAFLAVPLYDTLTVFIKRKLRGDGVFTPGRDHVHHQLLDIGFSQRHTTIMLYLVTILISLLAISISHLDNNIVLGVVILSMFSLLPTNGFKRDCFKSLGIIDLERYLTYKERISERNENREWKRQEREVEQAG